MVSPINHGLTDEDVAPFAGNEIELRVTYTISVYATKPGYADSDEAIARLVWIDVEPKTYGIENSVAEVRALPVLLQSDDGSISIQGLDSGAQISVYDKAGRVVGSAKAVNGTADIRTSLKKGQTAIVKVGKRAIKILMH